MKTGAFHDLDPATRSFILITIAVAFPAWDLGFEIGAYGRLFFEKVFVTWSISTAMLIVLLMLPRKNLRVPRIAWFATAIPSLWLLFALVAHATPDVPLYTHALTIVGFVTYLACFPYVIYMSISIAYPDLLKLERALPKIGLTSVIVIMLAGGYVVGSNHSLFLTCEDFEISGNHVPEDCGQPG